MQNERAHALKIFITNLPAIIFIALMSILLKLFNNYNVILSFIVLSIAYVVLGIVVEMILEKFSAGSPAGQTMNKPAEEQKKPKLVDLSEDTVKKPVKKISKAPYAEYAADRLRKTKLNFNDLLDVNGDTLISVKKDSNKVTVINDYNSLLKKAKATDKPESTETKTINVAKINESENDDVKIAEEKKDDLTLTEVSESDDDFTVKSSNTLEDESDKIKNEIDKRLSGVSKIVFPHRRKKTDHQLENFSFDHKDNKGKDEKSEKLNDNEKLDDISFEKPDDVDISDKAVADSDLINELYKEAEVKKKEPFWKRFFR